MLADPSRQIVLTCHGGPVIPL